MTNNTLIRLRDTDTVGKLAKKKKEDDVYFYPLGNIDVLSEFNGNLPIRLRYLQVDIMARGW